MKSKAFRTIVGSLCVLPFALPVDAQAPSAAPPAQQPPAVRVTARLVEINVIVHDKKGQPVADLTRDDFVLLDQGQPQTISRFEIVKNEAPTAPPPTLPPNTFTNRYDQRRGVPPSVSVILLDGLNTRFEDQAYAKQQVIKFLSQLRPQDHVGLYALGSRLVLLHDFTTDASSLLAALGRYRGRASPELSASEPEEPDTGIATKDFALDDALSQALQPMQAFYTTYQRVLPTLQAFRDIANRLAGLPGRKSLIWVSGSFPITIGYDQLPTPDGPPIDQRNYNDDIDRAARLLNDANIAIYPVDARGLMPSNVSAANRRSPLQSPRARRMIAGPAAALHADPNLIDTMQALADRTGGRAFYNTNDLQGAIRRAIEDSEVTYLLGYYPDHGTWDGRFRQLKVEVKRPGVNLRYRRGYFALPDAPPSDQQRHEELSAAVSSPVDATVIPVTVHIEKPEVPGTNSLSAQLNIDPGALHLRPENHRWVGTLELVWVESDDEGKVIKALEQTLHVAMLPQTYEQAQREGMQFTKELEIYPGATRLRIIVRDDASSALGSVTIPLATPSTKNAG